MRKILGVFALLTFSHFSYAQIDCNTVTNSDDLIFCAKQSLKKSTENFDQLSTKLMSSVLISPATKRKLNSYYAKSAILLAKACKDTFPDGRLRDMYIDSCIAAQLDTLSQSKRIFICAQQDAEGCQ